MVNGTYVFTSGYKNASSIRMLTHFVFLKTAVFWNHLLVWKLIFMSYSNLYRQKENVSYSKNTKCIGKFKLFIKHSGSDSNAFWVNHMNIDRSLLLTHAQ